LSSPPRPPLPWTGSVDFGEIHQGEIAIFKAIGLDPSLQQGLDETLNQIGWQRAKLPGVQAPPPFIPNTDGWLRKGNAFKALGASTEAAESGLHLIRSENKSTQLAGRQFLTNVCVDLLKSGETGLAEELLRKLVDVDPADSVAHYYLGLIPEAKGEPANAI